MLGETGGGCRKSWTTLLSKSGFWRNPSWKNVKKGKKPPSSITKLSKQTSSSKNLINIQYYVLATEMYKEGCQYLLHLQGAEKILAFCHCISSMSQHWFSGIIYAGSLVPLWGSDRQNGFYRRAEQITAALSLSWLKCWTQETQLHLQCSFLYTFWFWFFFFRGGLVIVCFPPQHNAWNYNYCEEFVPQPLWSVSKPVATFHLDDERQVYGRPSLLRTIGSRVSCNRSLSQSPQCQTGWAMLSPAHAYWLK